MAAQAKRKSTWPALRRYAESARAPEERGRAYLVLGYNEYDAGEFARGAADLGRAAATGFSFTELATYYEGEAAQASQQPLAVVQALRDFASRYPRSLLHYKALDLLGQALLKTAQPEQAIELVTKDPKVHERPALGLLFARALWQVRRPDEAAKAFQDVYCNFPTSPEADIAEAALKNLQGELNLKFPAATVEQHNRRAELLFKAARWDAAMKEYETLLQIEPSGPHTGPRTVARARCLVYLRRPQVALESLSSGDWTSSEANPERLATLVLAYEQMNNEPQMFQTLDELARTYPKSQAHADALWSVGNHFLRQGEWNAAARHYAPLAEGFPERFEGREAGWRLAWNQYLQGEKDQAQRSLADYLARYSGSARTAAAVYWLGRLAEERDQRQEAVAFYDFVRARFANGYYARQADARLRYLRTNSARSALDKPRVLNASRTPAPLAALVAEQIPARKPPAAAICGTVPSSVSSDVLHQVLVLRILSLNGLAQRYLKAALAQNPRDPELLLVLARLEKQEGNVTSALFDAGKLVPNYSDYGFSDLPAEIWRMLYPDAYWKLVQRQARANRLDPYLVMGLIRQESAFNPRATSVSNARGLMQLLPQTAASGLSRRRQRAVSRKLYDPAYNVRIACRYLRKLINTFQGNLEESLAAYNAGDSRVREWLRVRSFQDPGEFLESIPFRETRYYVEALLRDAAIYRQMLSGKVGYKRCGE